MRHAGEAMGKAQAKAVAAGSAKLKSAVASSSPSRLSHVGKKGAALTVGVKNEAMKSTGTASGPWPIIEYDTPTHLIGIGRGAGGALRKTKRAKVKVSNGAALGGFLKGSSYGHPVRGPIVHPGTHGKSVFHKGVDAGTPPAVAELHKITWNAVKEVL